MGTTQLSAEEKLAAVAEFLNNFDNEFSDTADGLRKLFHDLGLPNDALLRWEMGHKFNSDLTFKKED